MVVEGEVEKETKVNICLTFSPGDCDSCVERGVINVN